MSLSYFPVAYYDEHGIWDSLSPHITSRLPILGVNLNLPEGDILIPPLPLKFLSHTESFWHENPEFTYKKPYLWIFILKFTNLEIFKRDIKTKLKELVHTMEEKNIEWLILFVPSFTRLVKSDHKSFASSYSKVSNELQSLLGKSNITRFYGLSNKTFVDLSQPSCIKDEYWAEFLRAVGKGVSVGIQTAICAHLKESCLQVDNNFTLYSLNLLALSAIYEAIGVKTQACLYLEMILERVSNSGLVLINEGELNADFQITGEQLNTGLINEKVSKVIFIRFLIKHIQSFYIQEKQYEKAAFATFKALKSLWGLFKSSKIPGSFNFFYQFSENCADLLSARLLEVPKENRGSIYLILANTLIMKMCSIQIISYSQHQEIGELELNNELLLITRKVYEYFGFAGYPCNSLFYKHLASSYAILLSKFELISEIINQHSQWPSIDTINSKLILTYDPNLSKSDTMKIASELCAHQYLPETELQSLWKTLIELSKSTPAFYSFSVIKAHTLKLLTVKQGSIFSVKLLTISNFPFTLLFDQVTARYSKDFGSFELLGTNITLKPGKNCLELWGIAWEVGIYKLEHVFAWINKFSCSFRIFSAFIEVNPRKQMIKASVSSAKSLKTAHFVITEFKIFNSSLQDIQIFIKCSQGVLFKEQYETITFSGAEKIVEKGEWINNELIIKDLKKNCLLYLIQEIDSSENTEGFVQFNIKSHEIEINLQQELVFSECFTINYNIQGDFCSIQLLNNNKYTVQLCKIQEGAENVELCKEQLPVCLDSGQQFHCFLTSKGSSVHLNLRYKPYPDPLNKLFQDYFTLTTPPHFEQSLHIQL